MKIPKIPDGTLSVTINTPNDIYLDDWWDYAFKYEIYINDKLKSESSFDNFEITDIDTEVGVHTVLCVITDAFGVWLYVMEKTATVQDDLVTELDFFEWLPFKTIYHSLNRIDLKVLFFKLKLHIRLLSFQFLDLAA